MTTYGAAPAGQGSALSCRRIVPLPFAACVAALDSWRLTAPGSELRLGPNVLRGPAEHDRHLGTRRIEVSLARGPLRAPLRMRLDIGRWSASSARTALDLIPCQPVRPTAAYFRSGHLLLDALTCALRQHRPAHAVHGTQASAA